MIVKSKASEASENASDLNIVLVLRTVTANVAVDGVHCYLALEACKVQGGGDRCADLNTVFCELDNRF